METAADGRVRLNGMLFDFPQGPVAEGKDGARTSFRSVWLDRYVMEGLFVSEYASSELRLLSTGRAFLDGEKVLQSDIPKVQEIFRQIGQRA